MGSIYDWSLDAASNANADTDIDWAEGQPPSSVNDSARAMMVRLAEYLRDMGGVVQAGGSANALTLTLNAKVSSYRDGIMVRFRAMSGNSGVVSVNVNMLGAKPIFMMGQAGLSLLQGGEIQANGLYDLVYVGNLNHGAGGWLLLTATPVQTIPVGQIASFARVTPPQGWLECDGAEVSRTFYANLFSAIGTQWGAGNGSITFQLPDLRGQFLRGWDNGRGMDVARPFASEQTSQNKNHNHGGFTSLDGAHSHSYTNTNFTTIYVGNGQIAAAGSKSEEGRVTQVSGAHRHQIMSDGGDESRPNNIAILYAIKV